jgi:lipoprotein-releasing system permease protein
MKLKLWLVWRYLRGGRGFLSLHVLLSVMAMALGVASLIIAMAIVSGYESTLRSTLIDSFGHLVVTKRGEAIKNVNKVAQEIKESFPEVLASTPFLVVEAVATHQGKIQGALLEGVDPESHESVINLAKHVVEGEMVLTTKEDEIPSAAIGKVLRQRLGVNVGDTIRVVVPITERLTGDRFRPRVLRVKVSGILDLGRFDFDERYVIVPLAQLQKFSRLEGAATGLRFRLTGHEIADSVAGSMTQKLGHDYRAITWFDSNRNLFEAINFEKPVIFTIVCLIVLAAGFTISGSLYVSVLRRYRDISVLKTIGANHSFIRGIFTTQGLLVGLAGSALGFLLGIGACRFLTDLQKTFPLFPGDVYRIDHVVLEVRPLDVSAILIVSLLICYLASLAPARRGARLQAVEGLRYE